MVSQNEITCFKISNIFRTTSASSSAILVILHTPDDALVVRNMLAILKYKLFHFVKPPSELVILNV